jgi:hypothetical protein
MSKIAPQLLDKIKYAARFPQTGVPLKQMVMFGNYHDIIILSDFLIQSI